MPYQMNDTVTLNCDHVAYSLQSGESGKVKGIDYQNEKYYVEFESGNHWLPWSYFD